MKEQKIQKQKSSQSAPVSPSWRRHPLLLIAGVFVFGTVVAWVIMFQWFGAVFDSLTFFARTDDRPSVTQVAAQEVTPSPVVPAVSYRLLDGIAADEADTRHWPVGVMIENLPSVRPQAGLADASVVYETLAEGGSTRFLAMFDPQALTTAKIGPVRSARQYYIEWLSEYDGLYAHAGGSPEALTVIREASIHNLEALSRDGVYFWRDRARSAPHNLYTSAEKLTLALRDKGLADKEASYAPWVFADEAAEDDRGADAKTLGFNFSSGRSYETQWTYNRANNSYRRINAGQAHNDENTGTQLEAKNIIVQLVEEPELDGTGKGRLEIFVGGTGDAWVAHNGDMIKATWKKASRTDRTRFYDADGKEIPMVRGNTWVHVIPKSKSITYE